jgi:hypothetical protein
MVVPKRRPQTQSIKRKMMAESLPFATVNELSAQGRFADAYRELLASKHVCEATNLSLFRLVMGELEVELGDLRAALGHTSPLLDTPEVSLVQSRARRVVARAAFHLGDFEASRRHLAAARSLAMTLKDPVELAHVELSRFALFSAVESLESVAASLPELRRLVTNPQSPTC